MRALVARAVGGRAGRDVGMLGRRRHAARTPTARRRAAIGESLAVLGWNMSVSNLRFDGDYVLFDVDASPTKPTARTPSPKTSGSASTARWRIRSRPTRSAAARDVTNLRVQPAVGADARPAHRHGVSRARCATSPRCAASTCTRRRTGSPAPRSPTPRRFPVGLPPTNENDTGLVGQDHQRRRVPRRRRTARPGRAGRPDRVHRQRLHAAGPRNHRSGSAIPRRVGAAAAAR